jgi:hypothetical protein
MDGTQNLTNHYLQVQALTPQSGAPVVSTSAAENFSFLPFGLSTTELSVIGAFFAIGIAILVITQVSNLKKALTILSLILMTSAVPISVVIMNQQTRIESNAGPDYVPKNVIITQVNSSGFSVMWDTDRPGTGVVRIRSKPETTDFNRIFSEPEGGDIYKHIIKIQDLEPNQTYYLEILSGGIWYDNQHQPLKIVTPP